MALSIHVTIQAFDRLTQPLKAMGAGLRELEQHLQGAAEAQRAWQSHWQATLATAREAGPVLAGIGLGIGALAKASVGASMQMEGFQAQFRTAMKDGQRAAEMFDWAKRKAVETPFEMKDVVDASVRLQLYGESAKKWFNLVGDMAGAMNRRVTDAVEAVADALRGEFERMKEFGIKSSDLLRYGAKSKAGGVAAQTPEEQARLSAALQAVMAEKFGGGMAQMMQTTQGSLSNLADAVFRVRTAIGDALTPAMRALIPVGIDVADRFSGLAQTPLGQALTVIATGFGGLALAIGPVLYVLPQLHAGWAAFRDILGSTAGRIGMIGGVIAGAVLAIDLMARAWRNANKEVEELGSAVERGPRGVAEIADKYRKEFDKISAVAKSAGEAAGDVLSKSIWQKAYETWRDAWLWTMDQMGQLLPVDPYQLKDLSGGNARRETEQEALERAIEQQKRVHRQAQRDLASMAGQEGTAPYLERQKRELEERQRLLALTIRLEGALRHEREVGLGLEAYRENSRQLEAVNDALERATKTQEKLNTTAAQTEKATDAQRGYTKAVESRAQAADQAASREEAAQERIDEAIRRQAEVRDQNAERIGEANSRVEEAERSLADTVKDQNRHAANAVRQLADVKEAAARREGEAAERVVEAERRKADAVVALDERIKESARDLARQRRDAEESVAEARKSAAERVTSAQERVQSAWLAMIKPPESEMDEEQKAAWQQYERGWTYQAAVREYNKAVTEGQEAVRKAERTGQERVAEAEERARKAEDESRKRIAEADRAVAKAREDAAQARRDSEKQIARAQETVENAREASNRAIADAQRRVDEAIGARDKAIREAQEAQTKADWAVAKAEDALAEAQVKAADTVRHATDELNLSVQKLNKTLAMIPEVLRGKLGLMAGAAQYLPGGTWGVSPPEAFSQTGSSMAGGLGAVADAISAWSAGRGIPLGGERGQGTTGGRTWAGEQSAVQSSNQLQVDLAPGLQGRIHQGAVSDAVRLGTYRAESLVQGAY